MKPRFREVCELQADLSGLQRSLVAQRDPATGVIYYTVSYTVAVLFGGTTLKARLRWHENVSVELNQTYQRETETYQYQGQLREGPITIIPNSMI